MFAYADILHCHRPISNRTRMSIGHRAKQFAPFAALKGYAESVQKKERIFYVKASLADEQKENLDWKFRLLFYGACISATYFERCMEFGNEIGSYHTVTGTVDFICKEEKRMRIGNLELTFDNIVEMNGDCFDAIEYCSNSY